MKKIVLLGFLFLSISGISQEISTGSIDSLVEKVITSFRVPGIAVGIVKDGKITDVEIEYPRDYTNQMMEYGKKYSFLPTIN